MQRSLSSRESTSQDYGRLLWYGVFFSLVIAGLTNDNHHQEQHILIFITPAYHTCACLNHPRNPVSMMADSKLSDSSTGVTIVRLSLPTTHSIPATYSRSWMDLILTAESLPSKICYLGSVSPSSPHPFSDGEPPAAQGSFSCVSPQNKLFVDEPTCPRITPKQNAQHTPSLGCFLCVNPVFCVAFQDGASRAKPSVLCLPVFLLTSSSHSHARSVRMQHLVARRPRYNALDVIPLFDNNPLWITLIALRKANACTRTGFRHGLKKKSGERQGGPG
ncbi:hypothetical protein BDDG_01280 [Blastomyces dermatitidis ATCC 18188]|uniref:Uncharacterized protein n=1 Tax=Ajellomyces dermatitidis (strain ATCC 18188 / CBS 674.68) TaxID=653446 RepID=F2T5B8_AJEDA|nr:hypothetical protein BDDG_01280 [Blastomyces dermatitidis ATCC 18188]